MPEITYVNASGETVTVPLNAQIVSAPVSVPTIVGLANPDLTNLQLAWKQAHPNIPVTEEIRLSIQATLNTWYNNTHGMLPSATDIATMVDSLGDLKSIIIARVPFSPLLPEEKTTSVRYYRMPNGYAWMDYQLNGMPQTATEISRDEYYSSDLKGFQWSNPVSIAKASVDSSPTVQDNSATTGLAPADAIIADYSKISTPEESLQGGQALIPTIAGPGNAVLPAPAPEAPQTAGFDLGSLKTVGPVVAILVVLGFLYGKGGPSA